MTLIKHKHNDKGMYSIYSHIGSHFYTIGMMCRLFGYPNTHKFSYIMDCTTILSNNIDSQIITSRKDCKATAKRVPHFFISAYIMDAI